MKKILLLLSALILTISCAMAQKGDWISIKQAAQQQNTTKLYVVDFYTSWCGWCKKMDAETFNDPTVKKLLNKYYIPVKFDAEGQDEFSWMGKTYTGNPSQNGRKTPHQFAYAILGQKMGYPSTAIFSSNKSLMTVLPGYYKPEDFAMILWYFASGDCNKYSWEKYEKIFDHDIRPAMLKALK
ncbi:MAG: thioredoxin domain-containing protein [Bacteroidales bacterium]|nr:thioredoxin domain-containing protein [Bacteroidales bacterium]